MRFAAILFWPALATAVLMAWNPNIENKETKIKTCEWFKRDTVYRFSSEKEKCALEWEKVDDAVQEGRPVGKPPSCKRPFFLYDVKTVAQIYCSDGTQYWEDLE